MDKEKENNIVLPYTPRPIWEKKIHPALDKYKRAVIVCHRRFGKSTGMLVQTVKAAINDEKTMPRYAYVAPYRNQAKTIAWETLKMLVNKIPGMRINESELYVEFPTKHEGAAGARIYVFGADNPDRLRGAYLDGVILDEYADIKKDVWEVILSPQLMGRDGFAYFVGTPKGQNQFYEQYKFALSHKKTTKQGPGWYTSLFTAYDNLEFCNEYLEELKKKYGAEYAAEYAEKVQIITEAQIEEEKATMTETKFRQEYMVDFTASATEVVIPIDLIDKSVSIKLTERDVPPEEPVILGVDVARYGDDRTVIFKRQGLWLEKPRVYTKLDVTEVADRVVFAINDYQPDMVFVDEGAMGAGVIDVLHRRGYSRVEAIGFGRQATRPELYENMRAEMYFKLKEAMENGLALVDDPDLKQELSSTEYFYTRRGRIALRPKEEIKKTMGVSPDLADGLVLTFAKSVGPRWRMKANKYFGDGNEKAMCNTNYSVLDDKNLLNYNF